MKAKPPSYMNKTILLLHTGYESLRSYISRVPQFFATDEGTVVQDGRNLIKNFIAPDGTELNIKRYHPPHHVNLFIYSFGLREPKGKRAFLYPQRLLAAGIDTPEPVAYIEERRHGMLGHTYFVSIRCPYRHKCYEWGDAAAGTYEPFARALGAFTAKMHAAGILHLDYSPGNILWDEDDEGYHFSLVDINQMRFGAVSRHRGANSFSRLWGPKRMIAVMAGEYARLRGFDETAFVAEAMACRERFWRRYQRRKPEKVKFNLEF